MASGFFALLDDIATLLDDISVMTKVAAQKTSAVLGDDLALNAQQVAGVEPNRELPVVYAVARGSAFNKIILVPSALLISTVAPAAVLPLLMIGGLYLCFEGAEKIHHLLFHSKTEETDHQKHIENLKKSPEELLQLEKSKIKGAVRTDFVLSAEIIVISLGTVSHVSFLHKFGVLSLISILMTVGVYGLVALIIKADDFGLWMQARRPLGWLSRPLGGLLVHGTPKFMKLLSVVGTAAMFLVGGGILNHAVPVLHHATENFTHSVVLKTMIEGLCGLVAGILLLLAFKLIEKFRSKKISS